MSQSELNDLSQYQWKNRVLLIFHGDGIQGDHQQEAFADKAELQERDLIIFNIGSKDSPLRSQFNIGSEEFATVLIGKDGGEKATYKDFTKPEVFYALIDSMPIRMREMTEPSSSLRN